MNSESEKKPKDTEDVTSFKAPGFEFSGPTWFASIFLVFCFFVAYGIFFNDEEETFNSKDVNTEVSHPNYRSTKNSNTKPRESSVIPTGKGGVKNENEKKKCDGSWGENQLDCPL